jgi:acetyl-CoA carboxylase/biotin carboxylase 1
VWVGWGFASENPILPDKLNELSPQVTFIGPPSSAMRALGDKIASTIVAQSANVPCVDWSGQGVTLGNLDGGSVSVVPDELYQQATVHSLEEGLIHAKRIGFPIMVSTLIRSRPLKEAVARAFVLWMRVPSLMLHLLTCLAKCLARPSL